MIVYHGTTLAAAEAIKRNGLKPNLAHAFKLFRTDYRINVTNRNLAYVTPDKNMAEAFARFRANYERAVQGAILNWRGELTRAESEAMGGEAEFIKKSAARNPHAEPALVEIDLPDTWRQTLKPDPAGPDSRGLVYPGTIPAEYVAKIEPLRLRLNDRK